MDARSPRFTASWLLVSMVIVSSSPVVAATCVDYEDFIHWKSEVYASEGGWSAAVAAEGSRSCLASSDENGVHFRTIDLSDPSSPVIAGNLTIPIPAGYVNSMAIADDYAYLAGGSALHIIDVHDFASPRVVGSLGRYAAGVAVDGSYAYVVGSVHPSYDFMVVDVSDPDSLRITGSIDLPDYTYDVAVENRLAYAVGYSDVGGSGSLHVI